MSTSEALRNVLRIPNLYLIITFIDITALWLFFNMLASSLTEPEKYSRISKHQKSHSDGKGANASDQSLVDPRNHPWFQPNT